MGICDLCTLTSAGLFHISFVTCHLLTCQAALILGSLLFWYHCTPWRHPYNYVLILGSWLLTGRVVPGPLSLPLPPFLSLLSLFHTFLLPSPYLPRSKATSWKSSLRSKARTLADPIRYLPPPPLPLPFLPPFPPTLPPPSFPFRFTNSISSVICFSFKSDSGI